MSDVADFRQEMQFETFSYLPALTSEEIRAQIQYVIVRIGTLQ